MAGLQLKVGLIGADRISKPFNQARQSTVRLRSAMSQATGKVRDLERTAGDLDSFRHLKAASRDNARALAGVQAKADHLAREMAGADKVTGRMRSEFAAAKKEATRLKTALHADAQTMQGLRTKLRATGVDTRKLGTEQKRLAGELDDAQRAANQQAGALDRARKRSERLARTRGGIMRLGRAFGTAALAAGGLGRKVAGLLGPLGALGGIASAAGAAKLVTGFASANDELSKFSRQIGFTAEGLQELQYAADRQGVSQATFNSSIAAFSKRLGELRAGTGAMNTLLKKSNPALAAQLKAAKSSEEAFGLMMRALERIEDPQKRAALAAAAFSRSGMVMTRVAEAGSDGLAALREDARRLGIVVSNDTAAASEGFVDTMTRFQASVDGLGKAIASRLMPAVQPMIDRVTDWVVANRDILATRLDGLIDRVAAAASRVDLDRVVAGITAVATGIGNLVSFVGGWENAMIGLFVMMNGPLIGGLASMAGGILSVASAARTALPFVVNGIRAITAAMMANPLGLILGGIAIAATLLVAYWKPISTFFANLWDQVGGTFSSAWEGIKSLFAWTPVGLLVTNWGSITDFFSGLWAGITGGVATLWDGVKAAFGWTPLGLLVNNWGAVTEFFGGLLDGITGMFGEAWDWILNKIASVAGPLGTVIEKVGGLFDSDDGDADQPARPAPKTVRTRPVAAATAAAAVAAASPAAVTAAPPAGSSVVVQEMHVHAAPGMDERQLAEEVRRQLEAIQGRDRARSRARLHDGTD